jgi:hypothetical protein
LDSILRLSAPFLNNSIKTVLRYRTAILNNSIREKGDFVKPEVNLYGEDVKMVRTITQKQKYFTDTEKDDVVVKYESGMSMAAIAKEYKCYPTTVRKVLRQRGVLKSSPLF